MERPKLEDERSNTRPSLRRNSSQSSRNHVSRSKFSRDPLQSPRNHMTQSKSGGNPALSCQDCASRSNDTGTSESNLSHARIARINPNRRV
ncbi:hypothetical protein L484_023400 [Morus notabilis]|uniref:Uncharacterized protein n=1 Tax=Morus notabilis TaxID=981085 RepID=W9S5L5_9ROSA|nr:hypothetical protein L484_023400 [Morus notabilis]